MPGVTTVRNELEALLPHCTLVWGHHLDGAGPARHGWGAVTAAGQVNYLTRHTGTAISRAEKLGVSYGSGD